MLRRVATRQLARLTATTTDTARVGGPRITARWWREQLAYDPRPDLARIPVPVLAVTGEKDTQVDPDDLDVIACLVPNGAETHRTAGLTHVLRRTDGPASVFAYRRLLRAPVDDELLTTVAPLAGGPASLTRARYCLARAQGMSFSASARLNGRTSAWSSAQADSPM